MANQTELIYLAGPYSHALRVVRQDRFNEYLKFSARLLNLGINFYSPILHYHQLAFTFDLNPGYDLYKRSNEFHLDHATHLWILALQGYQESKGVEEELRYYLDRNHDCTANCLIITGGMTDADLLYAAGKDSSLTGPNEKGIRPEENGDSGGFVTEIRPTPTRYLHSRKR